MVEAVETTTTPVAYSSLLRSYTLEEFWRLPEPPGRAHYELIGGALFMVPPPDPPHGDLVSRLTASLVLFLAANENPGVVYHPREAIMSGNTYLEPDMMYVSNEVRRRMGDQRSSADIVFEYLSESTANYDRTTKADTYLALGVRELWLIDPATSTIEVRHASEKDGSPVWRIARYAHGENAESAVLEGWRVAVDELFAGLV